jgi:hypothetical protein
MAQGTAMPSYGANIQINLHTADPGEAGTASTSVATFTGYASELVPRDNTGWTICDGADPWNANASGPAFKNAALIEFDPCTGGSNTITHVSLSVVGSGQILYSTALDDSIDVSNLVQVRFEPGTLRFVEN